MKSNYAKQDRQSWYESASVLIFNLKHNKENFKYA